MTLRRSMGMRDFLLDEGSYKDALDYGFLRIFSGTQPSSANDPESGDLLMEISEQMPATYVANNEFTVSGDQTTIFADGRTLRANVGMSATYGSSSTLILSGDKTTTFAEDVSFKADCGADGTKVCTVASSSYDSDSGNTTVTTNESTLTSNLDRVTWLETITVASSSYSDPSTTVTIDETVLTDDLSTVRYGIRLGDAADGAIQKAAEATLKGEGKKTGTGGYFRLYSNDLETGGGTSPVCVDGSFGSSGDLRAVSTSVEAGAESSISTFKLAVPA